MSEPRKMSPVFEGPDLPPRKKKGGPLPLLLVLAGLGSCVLLILVAAAVLFPVFAQARREASRTTCLRNVRSIAAGSLMYAADNDGRLPLSETWASSLGRYVRLRPNQMLVCPVARRESRGWGIACNSEISGQVLAKLQAASQVPVAFDSTDLARGASASIDTLPAPGRHNSRGLGNNVSFADGSARFVRGSLQPAKKPGL